MDNHLVAMVWLDNLYQHALPADVCLARIRRHLQAGNLIPEDINITEKELYELYQETKADEEGG
jgi:hypothetical protein